MNGVTRKKDRTDYNRQWRLNNPDRHAIYNRAHLAKQNERFKTGERTIPNEKRCKDCGETKAAGLFYRCKANKDGLYCYCKVCSDTRTVAAGRLRLGVSQNQFKEMLALQGGRCAICATETPQAGKRSFSLDHDHKTGRVRGILCTRCNTMIGNALDDPRLLNAAIDYLAKHSSGVTLAPESAED